MKQWAEWEATVGEIKQTHIMSDDGHLHPLVLSWPKHNHHEAVTKIIIYRFSPFASNNYALLNYLWSIFCQPQLEVFIAIKFLSRSEPRYWSNVIHSSCNAESTCLLRRIWLRWGSSRFSFKLSNVRRLRLAKCMVVLVRTIWTRNPKLFILNALISYFLW